MKKIKIDFESIFIIYRNMTESNICKIDLEIEKFIKTKVDLQKFEKIRELRIIEASKELIENIINVINFTGGKFNKSYIVVSDISDEVVGLVCKHLEKIGIKTEDKIEYTYRVIHDQKIRLYSTRKLYF